MFGLETTNFHLSHSFIILWVGKKTTWGYTSENLWYLPRAYWKYLKALSRLYSIQYVFIICDYICVNKNEFQFSCL